LQKGVFVGVLAAVAAVKVSLSMSYGTIERESGKRETRQVQNFHQQNT
jgi:hypothetical protein